MSKGKLPEQKSLLPGSPPSIIITKQSDTASSDDNDIEEVPEGLGYTPTLVSTPHTHMLWLQNSRPIPDDTNQILPWCVKWRQSRDDRPINICDRETPGRRILVPSSVRDHYLPDIHADNER